MRSWTSPFLWSTQKRGFFIGGEMRKIDLTGKRFGRLTVLRLTEKINPKNLIAERKYVNN